jgi:sterol desaturase/sphingolipid hydroxylase (fatty acid hydroxylase superfamily)
MMDAVITFIETMWRSHTDLLAVTIVSIGFFYFSRHWLKREIFKSNSMTSIIVTMSITVANMMMVPLAYYTNEHVTALYGQFNIPSVSPEFWAGWPLWALCILAVLLHDLVEYWAHRFMHMKWLWPIHAIHHSDPDVNGFTTFRVHILEVVFTVALLALFQPWLGLPKEASALTGTIIVLLNAYVHFDVDWGHGPLRYVIASPRFHRWHHADTPAYYGKNLANVFPFYDLMFGTYLVPGPCREPMGAIGVPENNFIKLMAYPFTETYKMIRLELSAKKARQRQQAAQATPAE